MADQKPVPKKRWWQRLLSILKKDAAVAGNDIGEAAGEAMDQR